MQFKCSGPPSPLARRLVDAVLLVLESLPEPLLEQAELGDQVGDGVHHGVVGRVVGGRLDPQHDLGQSD